LTNRDQDMPELKIEDLPLKDRLERAQKYNIYEHIKEGYWIDAVDTIQQWCLAKIVDVTERSVKVHYDGWPSRWDADLKVTGSKISPFRKETKGYTGQVKTTI